jgi:betaine-aldehyde dehydrogenase
VADAGAEDVAAAVAAAKAALPAWSDHAPAKRAQLLREMATVLRAHTDELAMLDAADCGNPVRELRGDIGHAAEMIEYFAGLVRELKGETVPLGPGQLNYIVREPLGVIAKIVPFNHPLMFAAMKVAAPSRPATP